MFSKKYRRNKPSQQSIFESSGQEQAFIPPVQARLNIGQPGDIYEQEADRTADRVVAQTETTDSVQKMETEEEELQAKPLAENLTPFLQRQTTTEEEEESLQMQEEEEEVQMKCDACEEEDKVQKQEEEEKPIQAKNSKSSAGAPPNLQRQLKMGKGSGNPLDQSTRSKMELAFGNDFSKVSIHTGREAQLMSKQLNAQAFTHGNDIYFNSGKYNPTSKKGKHLLAHELTHTIQQGGAKTNIQAKLNIEDDYPSDYVGDFQTVFNVNDPKGQDPSKRLSKKERRDLVKSQIEKISPHFSADNSGNVTQQSATQESDLAKDSKATGSCCLHVLSRPKSKNPWQILVADSLAPHTLESEHKVLINSNVSPITFGAHNKAGEKFSYAGNPELILGHELCGHASLMEIGAHAEGRRAITNVHDSTINIENEIAKSLGRKDDQLRGLASDGPHKGESFGHAEVINFDFNKSSIKSEGKEKLKLLADMIRAHDLFVEVRGHSDNVGSESAKQSVSLKRAERVASFLFRQKVALQATINLGEGKKVKANRFLLKGMSDKEPLAGINPETEQHKLRRVDVIVSSFPAGLSELPQGFPPKLAEKLKEFNQVKEPEKVQDNIDWGTPCEKLLSEKAYRQKG